ncbi:glycoside hydrolase family 127 protein [Chryseolinea sp. T2]|uniref:glycoside hydrolase family 127 protein n=1 Tax=Chryseolinea sp. T2 TaxID=3129255 RepID=UPI003076C9A0
MSLQSNQSLKCKISVKSPATLITVVLLVMIASLVKAQQVDYSIQAVPFTQVKFNDKFWLPRIRTNHTVTIPASFERCEATGRVKNFEMAAAHSGAFCTVYPFDDTDIYKTIEGASFSLSLYPDKALELYIDTLIQKVAAAQEPDGYLYTARTIDPLKTHKWAGKERWEKERELSHELYNSGHLYEAAVAHYMATGKRNLLNVAIKNADLVCSVFGPGRRHVAPGHEVVEMGLVKMYRLTGNKKYLETAKDFLEERGRFAGYDSASKDPWKNGAYWQDHIPVTKQREAVGHAVRAGYLYSAMADVAALTNDAQMVQAVDSIWQNVVQKKIYVQGGIGAVGDGERFGQNYELPNRTAYNETCAAIANIYWNQRMFLLHGDAKYIDVLEKTLYNGMISGVGMDGNSFFYTNAMEITSAFRHSDMEGGRSGWFTCSCCPTNVTRLIPSIPGYVYATSKSDIFINLFVSGTSNIKIDNRSVEIVQQNDYPWSGALKFTINPSRPEKFALKLRIPGWARGEAIPSDLYSFTTSSTQKVTILVNGNVIPFEMSNGYAVLNRSWRKGDRIEVVLPMDIQRVVANNKLIDDRQKVALQRGPIIYCAEWKDNDAKVSDMIVPQDVVFSTEFVPGLLNGVQVIRGQVPAIEVKTPTQVTTISKSFTAIPYYAWAHRGTGEMMVWFPVGIKDLTIIPAE